MSGLKQVIQDAEKEGAVLAVALKEREGRCFEFALRLPKSAWDAGCTDSTLVHGVITGYHRDCMKSGHELRIAHGWLEKADMVYEPTADMIFRKEDFYRDVEAIVERRYSFPEAALLYFMHGTFGPWHESAGAFT